jgi:branched-chain amino acid transport system substrate-binding protein
MAEEDINKKGINGSKLEVLIKDAPFDPKVAVTRFRECALQDKVFAVFGPYSSGDFDQAAPLSDSLKVPVVGATTTKVGAAKGHPYAFRMTIPDDLSTEVGVKAFKATYPKVKKVAIIGGVKHAVIKPVTTHWFPKFLKQYGFEVVGTSEFTMGMTDMSAVVTKAKAMNPEGLAVDGLPAEWALLAKELARQGVKLPTLSGPHPWPGNTVFRVKNEVEGWIAPAFFQEDLPGAERQAWVKRFKKLAEADPKIPKPVYAAVEPQMYDAMMAVAEIMRKAGVNGNTPLQQARDAIRDGLLNLKGYKGIVRTYTMDKVLHDAAGAVYPVVARNGRWELLK